MKYSIIVPIYKEKNNISSLITKITSVLKKSKIIFEMILVDDQSNDGSKEEYKKSKNKYTKFFIRKVAPKDLSKSVTFGIKKSTYGNIIVMDGDLQHSPKELLKLINVYKKLNYDLVIGSRNFNNLNKSLSFFRSLSSKILIFVFNILFNLKISDPMSGFFIINKKVFKKCEKKLFNKGYKILADIVLCNKNIKIKEVLINFKKRKRDKSKMGIRILIILLYFFINKFFLNLFK
jgi:dolichol-phosphate mannosyltransferase|tara:strand:- start:419 stop:1120 length:702 start_codon:yes stop_codon:yes gene_type:complete